MNKKILVFIIMAIMVVTCVENHVLPKFGKLSITSDPIGATIYKNGVNTGKTTPTDFDELVSGAYDFSLSLNSFNDTSFTIQVNEDTEYSEDIFLTEEKPLGKITLTSTPSNANIFLDGKSTGEETPAVFENLSRGNYLFVLKRSLYEDHNVNIDLSQNEVVERDTRLVVAGTAGSLFITSNPVGASIIIDDNATGLVTPDTLVPISAGQHFITLSLTDYRDTTISSTIVAGSVVEETVVMTLYEPRGSITINSNPQGAQIFLDGSNTGLLTPNTLAKIEAGTYTIKLHIEDYYDSTFTVTVPEDQNKNVGTIDLTKIPIYKITAKSFPTGASTITGAGEYKHGENVTLTTVGNIGYRFIKWTENGSLVSTNKVYPFTALKNRSLVAKYVEIGNLKVNSDPEGAKIYLNDVITGFTTPHTFKNILTGQYKLTLKLVDFADTSHTVPVHRNQTTNVGTVYMRDIVPEVLVNLTSRIESGSGRLIFPFFFNQDITLIKVEFTKPDGSTLTQNFGGQSLPKGRVTDVSYPEKIVGVWRFKFYGNKAAGRKNSFVVTKILVVN